MDALLEGMTARQFAEWAAYAELEPFGPNAGWVQAGTVAAAALAPWAEKGEAPGPADFFPHLADGQEDDPEARARAMRDACLAWAGAVGTVVGEVK